MKSLIIFTILFSTLNTWACESMPKEIDGYGLGNIFYQGEEDEDMTSRFIFKRLEEISVNETQRQLIISIGEANEECLAEDMTGVVFETKSKAIYTAFYSTDDYCDGGNSVGYVADENGKPVANIGDSEFYCLAE